MASSISSSKPSDCRFAVFAISLAVLLPAGAVLNFLAGSLAEAEDRQAISAERKFWDDKATNPNSYGVVLLGDSRTYRGIDARTVGGILGRSCYNFGYSAGGLNREMFRQAEKNLDPSVPGATVILGITPLSLSEEARKNAHFHTIAGRNSPTARLERFWDPDLFFHPVSLDRWRNFRRWRKNKPKKIVSVCYDSGWSSESTPVPPPVHWFNTGLALYRARMVKYVFSEASLEELTAAVRGWTERGIRVFGFRPPSSTEMEKIENTKYDEPKVRKAFEAAGGIYLTFPADGYQTYDASHLTTDSSRKFSRDLAEAVLSRSKPVPAGK